MAELFKLDVRQLTLRVTIDYLHECIALQWHDPQQPGKAVARIVVKAARQALKWELHQRGVTEQWECGLSAPAIRAKLKLLATRFATDENAIAFEERIPDEDFPDRSSLRPLTGLWLPPWRFLAMELYEMGRAQQSRFGPLAQLMQRVDPDALAALDRQARREERLAQQQAEIAARIARFQQVRGRQLQAPGQKRKAVGPLAPPRQPALPVPDISVRFDPPQFDVTRPFAGVFETLADLRDYRLLEQAAQWWVANQSDDLLALPHCAIEHLDYQLRTALRVIGPLRGRALLSDEVGLGKTIEAGLVLKEYLVRGMVKRFLVLTLPSLVDQWQEELDSKFRITTVTTNSPQFRTGDPRFWREQPALIASIHTLKQDANLAHAQQVAWDMLIVDEAHYLRNRTAKTWQAVNALPRQFLLLLTATPVQNSLEEIYNLVTLLKPGQLPSPQEFRARFLDPARPRQPRDPAELRRLLGQVMIRNTRANAGIKLPPRRAETVVFTPTDGERAFWETWERELREALGTLTPSLASLWGRLLLQAAGSSPQAWRAALDSFPDPARRDRWRDAAPLSESWQKKTAVLPSLAKSDGGLVVFSQFLETQAALADALRAAGLPVWVINGQTPAAQRQPLTDQFRAHGGALLLTHSGTEGRNLQFCRRLVNFDLPWNPMELEQRIGRLHRLGQQHPVEIFNLVQAGTLQAHLLDILQEKLNLFELVVGETGLILGDRFSSDDFAEEVFRRWRDSAGNVAGALQTLGEELAGARREFEEIKRVDQVLFERDYETA